MRNQNLVYFCILYQNGVPVGFIDKNGYICSKVDSDCKRYVENDGKIHLHYRLKTYARESVRIYHCPYSCLHDLYSLEYVEEKFERVEIAFECQ